MRTVARPLLMAVWACLLGICPLVRATAQIDNPGPAGASPPGAPPATQQAQPGGKTPQAPPLPVLLGYGEFLLIIDRPFDAEKLFKMILAMDPKSTAAQDGIRRAKNAERPTMTLLLHTYRDTIENRLTTYGGGPTFRTPYGNITFWAGFGYYRETIHNNKPNQTYGFLQSPANDRPLGKDTINLILQPYYRKWEGYLFLNQTFYAGAPDRTLFNFKVSYVPNPGREHYAIAYMRNDSFLQSDQLQFFAPETFYAVESGLTEDITSIELEHPLAKKVDFNTNYQYLNYSDGNNRNILRTQVLYRLLPKSNSPMPIVRVGLQHIYDNTKVFGVYYFTPQNFQSLSLAANMVVMAPKFKFILFGTYPFAKVRGTGYGVYDPLMTLFVNASYVVHDGTEVWAKLTTGRTTGFSASFTDFVIGINQRF